MRKFDAVFFRFLSNKKCFPKKNSPKNTFYIRNGASCNVCRNASAGTVISSYKGR